MFLLNGYKHGRAIARLRVRLHVRYYSARVVYAATRATGYGQFLSAVAFVFQLLTNKVIDAKVTFEDEL